MEDNPSAPEGTKPEVVTRLWRPGHPAGVRRRMIGTQSMIMGCRSHSPTRNDPERSKSPTQAFCSGRYQAEDGGIEVGKLLNVEPPDIPRLRTHPGCAELRCEH